MRTVLGKKFFYVVFYVSFCWFQTSIFGIREVRPTGVDEKGRDGRESDQKRLGRILN